MVKLYSVHDRPGSPAPDRDVVLVKEGFCWPAFFLTVLWPLWHRLWRTFIVVLLLGAGLEAALVVVGADGVTAAAAGLAYSIAIGYGAGDWRRSGLLRQGYRPLGVVAAANRDAALRRFYDLNPEHVAEIATATATGTAIGETVY
jgi:hypothetical protein